MSSYWWELSPPRQLIDFYPFFLSLTKDKAQKKSKLDLITLAIPTEMRERKKNFTETFSRQKTRAIEMMMISCMSDTFMRRKVNETNSHKLLDYSAVDKMLHDDNHRWLTFAYVHLLVTKSGFYVILWILNRSCKIKQVR